MKSGKHTTGIIDKHVNTATAGREALASAQPPKRIRNKAPIAKPPKCNHTKAVPCAANPSAYAK